MHEQSIIAKGEVEDSGEDSILYYKVGVGVLRKYYFIPMLDSWCRYHQY